MTSLREIVPPAISERLCTEILTGIRELLVNGIFAAVKSGDPFGLMTKAADMGCVTDTICVMLDTVTGMVAGLPVASVTVKL